MGMTFKSFVYVAAMTIGCAAMACHAHDLSYCSTFGDPSEDVVTRVKSVNSGETIRGPTVRLRRKPTADCGEERYCYIEESPPITEGMEGVELGRKDSWVCVAFAGKRPLDIWAGWIPVQRWKAMPSERIAPNWIGVWQNFYSKLWITHADDGQLVVKGDGIWPGSLGSPHFGDFSFVANPEEGILATPTSIPAVECHVALRIVGSFIFGADNGHCGATNVSFNGVYRFRPGLK